MKYKVLYQETREYIEEFEAESEEDARHMMHDCICNMPDEVYVGLDVVRDSVSIDVVESADNNKEN